MWERHGPPGWLCLAVCAEKSQGSGDRVRLDFKGTEMLVALLTASDASMPCCVGNENPATPAPPKSKIELMSGIKKAMKRKSMSADALSPSKHIKLNDYGKTVNAMPSHEPTDGFRWFGVCIRWAHMTYQRLGLCLLGPV